MTLARAGTGFFGGAFDPVHRGHLQAAAALRGRLGLQKLWLLPCAESPFPRRNAEPPPAPAKLRLQWLRQATQQRGGLGACGLELERGGPSYTVDTMRILRERLGAPPVFAVGSDAFAAIAKWREPRALLGLCNIAVLSRPARGAARGLAECLSAELARDFEFAAGGEQARHRSAGTWLRRIAIAPLDISSTQVRRRILRGEPVRCLLPAAVADAVLASGHYARAREPA